MSSPTQIPASLAIDGLTGDARSSFNVASGAGYHGIAFPTNHPELMPDRLDQSARRHLKTVLAAKRLEVDAIRVAVPRTSLTDTATIDRTLDNARKAFLLAHDLGVGTVSLHVGNLAGSKMPGSTLIAAIRELAQHADAAGLTLALGSDTSGPLAGMLKQVDYDRARINFDAARMIAGGEDPLKLAEEYAGLIGQVTAGDAVRAGHAVRPAFLGEGQLPVPELMVILQEQGFIGPLVVDVRELPDGAAGARHAAHVLEKLMRR
jgi:sugar phosphate isomerase/epimerase